MTEVTRGSEVKNTIALTGAASDDATQWETVEIGQTGSVNAVYNFPFGTHYVVDFNGCIVQAKAEHFQPS
jgi:hypothetical protein